MSNIVIITILGVIWIGHATAEFTTTLNKTENLNGGKFKFAMMKHIPKDRLYIVYGICKKNETISSTVCNIFREPLNNKSNGSSCQVLLKADSLDRSLTLHDFDDDKVIIYWYSYIDKLPNYYIRFTVVQFSDCSTTEARIRFDLQALRDSAFAGSMGAILPNGDKFTVAFDNSGIFGSRIDEQTFDLRGKVIDRATTWFKPLSKQSIMVIDNFKDDNNALLEFDVNGHRSRFSLLNNNGLKVLNESSFEAIEKAHYDMSNLHDTLSLCRLIESSKVDCVTFNANGHFAWSDIIELNHNPLHLTVHNLVDGSFFLITSTSEKLFYLSKFSVTGKHIATLELPGYKCNGVWPSVYTIPYEHVKNENCVMRICASNDEFNIVNKCFNDEDVNKYFG